MYKDYYSLYALSESWRIFPIEASFKKLWVIVGYVMKGWGSATLPQKVAMVSHTLNAPRPPHLFIPLLIARSDSVVRRLRLHLTCIAYLRYDPIFFNFFLSLIATTRFRPWHVHHYFRFFSNHAGLNVSIYISPSSRLTTFKEWSPILANLAAALKRSLSKWVSSAYAAVMMLCRSCRVW